VATPLPQSRSVRGTGTSSRNATSSTWSSLDPVVVEAVDSPVLLLPLVVVVEVEQQAVRRTSSSRPSSCLMSCTSGSPLVDVVDQEVVRPVVQVALLS
jgi:hypothetical protein